MKFLSKDLKLLKSHTGNNRLRKEDDIVRLVVGDWRPVSNQESEHLRLFNLNGWRKSTGIVTRVLKIQ